MITEKIIGKLGKTDKSVEYVSVDWFERDKKLAHEKSPASELSARLIYCFYFCMAKSVFVCFAGVERLRNYFVFPYDDRTYRNFSESSRLIGFFQRNAHEIFVA